MPKKDEPRITYTEANEKITEYFNNRRISVANAKTDMSEKSIKLITIKDEEQQAKEILDIIFGY